MVLLSFLFFLLASEERVPKQLKQRSQLSAGFVVIGVVFVITKKVSIIMYLDGNLCFWIVSIFIDFFRNLDGVWILFL